MDHISENLQDDCRFPPSPSFSSREQIPPEVQGPQDVLGEWMQFYIEHHRGRPLKADSAVLMGDYLIILAFEEKDSNQFDEDVENGHDNEDEYLDGENTALLFAVDLRDFDVQHVRLEAWHDKYDRNIIYICFYESRFILQKYNENQIIVFETSDEYRCSHMLTIDSFQPLSVRKQHLDIKRDEKLCENNVQISKACFYLIDHYSETNPLCFELQNQIWKSCKTIGGPEELGVRSFIFEGNLYAYNMILDISMFKFDKREWETLHRQEDYSEEIKIKLDDVSDEYPKKDYSKKIMTEMNGVVYREHLVFLVNRNYSYEKDIQLHCWNIRTNSWRIFNIKALQYFYGICKLIAHENSLWIVEKSLSEGIGLAVYNLINLGFEVPSEGKLLKELFLNETNSDVKFKVQDQIIPAHKEVLRDKFRFFTDLLNSGTAETKQDVVEIEDCDFDTFREFLRFIYCIKVEFDVVLAFKLLDFADKHLQNELKERCLKYLQWNIIPKTVVPILEGAYARNLQDIINRCYNFLLQKQRKRNHITLTNISGIIQCLLLKQNDYPHQLRDKVLDWIMDNYFEIYQKQNQSLRLCEEFLVKNIEVDTISRISEFIAGDGHWKSDKKKNLRIDNREPKEILEQETMKLRNAMYCFMQENFEGVRKAKLYPATRFLMDMIAEMRLKKQKNEGNLDSNDDKENMKNGQARDKKRKEPIQKEENETIDKPELKKTKKCEHCGK